MKSSPCRTTLQTAIFPCLGLGDGLIALLLAHNLRQEGREVVVYHPLLPQMTPLFPGITLEPRPEGEDDCFDGTGKVFIFFEKLDWMEGLIGHALDRHREKTTIFNPIATPNCDYPFWEEGRFDGSQPFVDNLLNYLRNFEGIEHPKRENGIALPPTIERRRYRKRIVIHPTSSRVGKNWARAKYLKLADSLAAKGFEPAFILTKREALEWPEIHPPPFENLVDLAHFVAESGYMIGNDSGIGHLASCLDIPTLTICRSQMSADFWRPAFRPGKVIVPPRFIPNLKGMRWRDQRWHHFIPISTVERTFLELCKFGVLAD